VTYRHYGEYIVSRWCNAKPTGTAPSSGPPVVEGVSCPRTVIKQGGALASNVGDPHGSPSPYPWPIPILAKNIAAEVELRGHFDPLYPDFQVDYPDQLRADEFLNEFDGFVSARKGGKDAMPQFILLRLPNDHTAGGAKGHPRPAASVADNDLAVGRVVDSLSHSPYWDDTAVLILEDDAQNGPDHVDSHRSIALVISKYSPIGGTQPQSAGPLVDHTFYTTVNMVRTIEALLGVPPMNANDARAAVMTRLFDGPGSQPVFDADYRNRDNRLLYEANAKEWNVGKNLDFSRADAADAAVLNRFLWEDRMGDRPIARAALHGLCAGVDEESGPPRDRPRLKDMRECAPIARIIERLVICGAEGRYPEYRCDDKGAAALKHAVWRASPTATMGRRGVAWAAFGLAAFSLLTVCVQLAVLSSARAAPEHLDPPIEDSTERELRQNTKALLDAIAPGDVGVWNRLLEDDALQVDENDVVRNKSQVLADLKPLGPGLRGHLDIDDFRVTRRGEVAVVTHEDDEYLDYHGQIIRSRFRMTDTWIHTSKGWRELGSQVLAVLQDPPAQALDTAVLCGYAGQYKMANEIIASVRCERDGLVVEREGRPARRFKAELADVFFEPGEPRTRRIFLRDRLGRITGFVDRREARDIHWTKMTPASPQVLRR